MSHLRWGGSYTFEYYEKTILLLDDIKAEGDTKLICAELLTKAGAQKVMSICLGINTEDISKNNV